MITTNTEVSSFGALLKALRQRQHLTQARLAQLIGVHRHAIGRWEQGDVLPASKTVVLELARHLRLDAQETRHLLEASLTALASYWSVPLPRNPFFTGREALLEAVYGQLGVEHAGEQRPSIALQGLGGIGKTQIALEYAYRHALEYSAVCWIAGETEEQMVSSLVQIAQALQLPERAAQDQQRLVTAVQRWLATHGQWLLIWDNLEDLGLLDRYLPPTRQGALLLTTRCQTLGTRAVALDLVPMEPEEGVLFLLRRAKVLEQAATREHLRQFALQRPAQYQAAAELVTEMGGLPLALDQAGAYLEATRCGLLAYLEFFRTQCAALLQERGEGAREHPASVWATFTLALAATAARHPAVGELLRVCALLQAEAIPEELFRQGAAQLGTTLEALCRDPLAWNRVVASACAYSLVSRHPEEQTLSLHRLVQAILLDTMSEAERAEGSRRAIAALDAVFPEVWYSGWTQGERLVPHALRCLHRAGAEEDSLVLASLAYKVAQYLRARARFAEAEPLYQRAEQLQAQLLGPDHLDVASSLNGLGVLYTEQGKFGQAEPLERRALAIREAVVGPAHPLVARSLSNLAVLCWHQGGEAEAEALYQRALDIEEQAPSPDAALRAIVFTNLAHLCRAQGREGEAEAGYQQALALWEQQFGPHHPALAEMLTGLAGLCRAQGREAEAEARYQRALHIREQALGGAHPEVAETLHELALFRQQQGRLHEARSLAERALSIRSQSLGDAHPKTLASRTLYAQLGEARGAIQDGGPFPSDAEELSNQGRKGSSGEEEFISPQRAITCPPPENDPLQEFLDACCELHPRAWCRSADLWQAYQDWVKERQEPYPLSRRALMAQLKERGCSTDRTMTARIWRGIAVVKKEA